MAPHCRCELSVRDNVWRLRCRNWLPQDVFERVSYCLDCKCPNGGSLLFPPEMPEVNRWLRGPPLPGEPPAVQARSDGRSDDEYGE